MSQSRRKLIGTLLMLVLLVGYPLIVMELYARYLGGAPWWAAILLFGVLGLLWFYPASWVIRWMVKPERS